MKLKNYIRKLFNDFNSNKKLKTLTAYVALLGFIFTLGYSVSVFNQNKKTELINININGLVYNMTTNSGESDDRILQLKANQIERFNITLTNLNNISTKYELIYDICSDSSCTSFVDYNKNISVTWNDEGESISGSIDAGTNNAKVIKIYTQNQASENLYIKLNLNAGYTWNDLTLKNQISTSGFEVGNNVDIIAYVDGVKVNQMPTGCGYTASVKAYSGTSEITAGKAEMTCNYLNDKWTLNLQDVSDLPTKVRVDFTTSDIPADAYVTNLEYKAPSTDEPFPYYTYRIYKTGYYKLETWGAQGHRGGRGGYSEGIAKLTAGQLLYIYIGSTTDGGTGGYNGGGTRSRYITGSGNVIQSNGGGGGATHIALKSGLLKNLADNIDSIIMVAGGGGGGYVDKTSTSTTGMTYGSGGGYTGTSSRRATNSGGDSGQAKGGSQTAGGNKNAGFGYGANTSSSAGGGGFYGGAGGGVVGSTEYNGGGGSGYINSTYLLSGKRFMFCSGCSESKDDGIYTVNVHGTSTLRDTENCPNGYSSNPVSRCAKLGNGHARITYLKDYVEE